jgi:hypothetical protein
MLVCTFYGKRFILIKIEMEVQITCRRKSESVAGSELEVYMLFNYVFFFFLRATSACRYIYLGTLNWVYMRERKCVHVFIGPSTTKGLRESEGPLFFGLCRICE